MGPDEEEVDEKPSWTIAFTSSGSTLAEAALLCLMAGLILFSIFSIAPRPEQAFPSQDAPTGNASPVDAQASATGAPLGAATAAATPSPAPSPTAAPATQLPARAPSPSATSGSGGTYVAKRGDTLFSIARTYHVTVDALAKANSLSDPRDLRAGQTLRIP